MPKQPLKLAMGTPAAWARELCRVSLILPQSTFDILKMSAIENNRSLNMEVRTAVEKYLTSANRVPEASQTEGAHERAGK
jgi:hypothetical protein